MKTKMERRRFLKCEIHLPEIEELYGLSLTGIVCSRNQRFWKDSQGDARVVAIPRYSKWIKVDAHSNSLAVAWVSYSSHAERIVGNCVFANLLTRLTLCTHTYNAGESKELLQYKREHQRRLLVHCTQKSWPAQNFDLINMLPSSW